MSGFLNGFAETCGNFCIRNLCDISSEEEWLHSESQTHSPPARVRQPLPTRPSPTGAVDDSGNRADAVPDIRPYQRASSASAEYTPLPLIGGGVSDKPEISVSNNPDTYMALTAYIVSCRSRSAPCPDTPPHGAMRSVAVSSTDAMKYENGGIVDAADSINIDEEAVRDLVVYSSATGDSRLTLAHVDRVNRPVSALVAISQQTNLVSEWYSMLVCIKRVPYLMKQLYRLPYISRLARVLSSLSEEPFLTTEIIAHIKDSLTCQYEIPSTTSRLGILFLNLVWGLNVGSVVKECFEFHAEIYEEQACDHCARCARSDGRVIGRKQRISALLAEDGILNSPNTPFTLKCGLRNLFGTRMISQSEGQVRICTRHQGRAVHSSYLRRVMGHDAERQWGPRYLAISFASLPKIGCDTITIECSADACNASTTVLVSAFSSSF